MSAPGNTGSYEPHPATYRQHKVVHPWWTANLDSAHDWVSALAHYASQSLCPILLQYAFYNWINILYFIILIHKYIFIIPYYIDYTIILIIFRFNKHRTSILYQLKHSIAIALRTYQQLYWHFISMILSLVFY